MLSRSTLGSLDDLSLCKLASAGLRRFLMSLPYASPVALASPLGKCLTCKNRCAKPCLRHESHILAVFTRFALHSIARCPLLERSIVIARYNLGLVTAQFCAWPHVKINTRQRERKERNTSYEFAAFVNSLSCHSIMAFLQEKTLISSGANIGLTNMCIF